MGSFGIFFTDLKNFFIRKFAHTTLFAERMTTISYGILNIIESCIPSKIFNGIIDWVAVLVAPIVFRWAWTNESFKNDSMNIIQFIVYSREQIAAPFLSWASISTLPATYSLKLASTDAIKDSAVAGCAKADSAWNMASLYPGKFWKWWQLRQGEHETTVINILHSVKGAVVR